MPRRSVVHLMTCVLSLVTALALLLAGATIGDAGGYSPAVATGGPTAVAVRAFYDAVNQTIETGDASALDTVVAPDLVAHALPLGTTPDRAGLARYLTTLHATVPAARLVPADVVVDGDQAMARVAVQGADGGAFLGMAVDDAPPVWASLDVFRVVDGRIVEHGGSGGDLAWLEPLQRLTVGTMFPTRSVVLLERLVVPPAGRLDVDLEEESHLIYVQAGELVVFVASDSPKPGFLAPSMAEEPDTGPIEVAPGSKATLAAGGLIALPVQARYVIQGGGTTAEALLTIVFRPGAAGRSTLRADPALVAGGAGTPLPYPLIPGGEQAAGASVALRAGGMMAELPMGMLTVVIGRATLPLGADVRLGGAVGPVLLNVESGAVGFEASDGKAWATRGPNRGSSELAEGELAAGDGMLLQPGTGVTLRNQGDEPLVLVALAIGLDHRPGGAPAA